VGAQYLSQQCVFRLAGPELLPGSSPPRKNAARLASVQDRLEAGHPGAVAIWRTMGRYLGYAVAHYAHFYDLRHLLLLGRCTSGSGGEILADEARAVLREDFHELLGTFAIHLPDADGRRIGQAVAAASLPETAPAP
jgi:predicted NBD/HSP70 family sugar kinase